MYGFARELFLHSVDDEFICSICHGVFKQPMTCQDGHSFCKDCITQWQRVNTHCPVDRSTLDRPLVRNLAVVGSIGRKLMKCSSTVSLPGGCSWTGLASAVEQHLPACDMNVVECKFKVRGCIFRAYQREIAQHLLVCPHRTVSCLSCARDIPHSDLSAHDEEWIGKLVSCPNDCGVEVARCKMLSHLAFSCNKEGRPCPLYTVGCTKVHSLAESDPGEHVKLLLTARLSGAYAASDAGLNGISFGGSWKIEGDVVLPICSPLFEGHAAVVRMEILKESGISFKFQLESKLQLPSFAIDLRCCFRSGTEKVKFKTPTRLMCQDTTACVEIHNVCSEDVFVQLMRSNIFFVDFLLTLSV